MVNYPPLSAISFLAIFSPSPHTPLYFFQESLSVPMEIGITYQLLPETAMKLTYRGIPYDKNPDAIIANTPMILSYRGVPYLKNRGVAQTIHKEVAVTYRGQTYNIIQSLASLPTEQPSFSL
jgi:Domain of unknown function (DUF4278)